MAVSAFWALMYIIAGIIAAAGSDRNARDYRESVVKWYGFKSNRDCFGAGSVSL